MLSLLKNAQVLLCVSFPSPLNSQFTTLQHDLSEKNLEPTPEDIFPTKCLMLGWIWVVCGPAVSILTPCVSCATTHQYAYTLASGSWFYFFWFYFFACPWHTMHLHKTLSRVSISLCALAICLSHPVTHLVQSLVCPALLFLPNFSLHNSGCLHLNAIIRSMKSEESSLSLAIAIAVSYQWRRNSFESAYL